jgi:hypothetical protein
MNITAKSALVASAMLAVTALTSGQASATKDKVYFKSLVFAGTGCSSAPGSFDIAQLIDADDDGFNEQFSLLFSNYVVASGPGTSAFDWRKNCNINATLHVPHGWQFSIVDVHYAGRAVLPYGIQGTQTSIYQFVFFSNRVRLSSTFNGPLHEDYDFTDRLPFTSLVWSPCGLDAPLNIATQIYLTGNRAYKAALLTSDQLDGHVQQLYRFAWRHCDT